MANGEKKKFIVVKNSGARLWEVNSLFDAAVEDGLHVEEYTSRDDVKKYFSDEEDVPAGYLDEAEKIGYPCLNVTCWHNDLDFWIRKEKFDPEYEARNFLMSDCEDIIPVESKDDALKVIHTYSGNHLSQVQTLAERILAEFSALED